MPHTMSPPPARRATPCSRAVPSIVRTSRWARGRELDEHARRPREPLAGEDRALLARVAVEDHHVRVADGDALGDAGAGDRHGEAALAVDEELAAPGARGAAHEARVDAAGELHRDQTPRAKW